MLWQSEEIVRKGELETGTEIITKMHYKTVDTVCRR